MSEVFSFTAANRAALIEELAARDVPLRLRVVPHGAARLLAKEVVLRVCSGRLIAIAAPELPAARALVRVALAESGRIEVSSDEPPPAPLGSFPALRRLYADAETAARALASVLAPIGGLGAIVTARSEGVMRAAAHLSRPALELGRMLIDVPRRVADVLLSLSQDDLQTARLLDQLRDAGALEVTPPSPSEISAMTTSGVRPVVSARPRGRRSVPPRVARRPSAVNRPSFTPPPQEAPLDVPELAEEEPSDDPMSAETWASVKRALPVDERLREEQARTEPPPQKPQPRPALKFDDSTTRTAPEPPLRAPERRVVRETIDEDAEAMRAAGVSDGNRGVWIVAVALILAAVGFVVWRSQQKEPEPPPIVTPVVEIPVKTTTTATIAAQPAPSPYSLSRPPPIAGPEADRRLREAEALINAGDYDGAEEILSELRKTRAHDATVWLLSGHLEAERGRFEKAHEYLDQALKISPRNYRGHVLKGSVFQFQGRVDSAVSSYRRALSIDPKHVMSPELRVVTDQLAREAG